MISWEDITEEVHEHAGFREAHVRVFRRYEGQETDELDGAGRVVKVTMASFARHLHIPKQTFADWCNPPEISTDTVPTSRSAQPSPEPDWDEWERQAQPTGESCFNRGFLLQDMIRSFQQVVEAANEADEFAWVSEAVERIINKLTKQLQKELQQ